MAGVSQKVELRLLGQTRVEVHAVGEVHGVRRVAQSAKPEIHGSAGRGKCGPRRRFVSVERGVNAILDAVITPLNVAANYVDRISKGDVPSPITDTYQGEFNTIKNNLNTLIVAMNDITRAAEEIDRK